MAASKGKKRPGRKKNLPKGKQAKAEFLGNIFHSLSGTNIQRFMYIVNHYDVSEPTLKRYYREYGWKNPEKSEKHVHAGAKSKKKKQQRPQQQEQSTQQPKEKQDGSSRDRAAGRSPLRRGTARDTDNAYQQYLQTMQNRSGQQQAIEEPKVITHTASKEQLEEEKFWDVYDMVLQGLTNHQIQKYTRKNNWNFSTQDISGMISRARAHLRKAPIIDLDQETNLSRLRREMLFSRSLSKDQLYTALQAQRDLDELYGIHRHMKASASAKARALQSMSTEELEALLKEDDPLALIERVNDAARNQG